MIDRRRCGHLLDHGHIRFIFYLFYCYYLFLSGAAEPFTVKKERPATAEEHLLLRELNVVLER